jgi:hypothetical protein
MGADVTAPRDPAHVSTAELRERLAADCGVALSGKPLDLPLTVQIGDAIDELARRAEAGMDALQLAGSLAEVLGAFTKERDAAPPTSAGTERAAWDAGCNAAIDYLVAQPVHPAEVVGLGPDVVRKAVEAVAARRCPKSPTGLDRRRGERRKKHVLNYPGNRRRYVDNGFTDVDYDRRKA